MNTQKREELDTEIERGLYVRAVILAESLGLPKEEIKVLQEKALCQMSIEYRNDLGTKELAKRYGFSKQDLRNIFRQYVEKQKKEGNVRSLGPRYNHSTRKYLSFEEWMNQFF
jgi:hypothetical protein